MTMTDRTGRIGTVVMMLKVVNTHKNAGISKHHRMVLENPMGNSSDIGCG